MNGPEHYREAEQLLASAAQDFLCGDDTTSALAAAQVHATLALAAATALSEPDRAPTRATIPEWDAWHDAAGVDGQGDPDDGMTNADIYTASELYEMDRDAEFRADAEDDARNTEQVEAEERGGE